MSYANCWIIEIIAVDFNQRFIKINKFGALATIFFLKVFYSPLCAILCAPTIIFLSIYIKNLHEVLHKFA